MIAKEIKEFSSLRTHARAYMCYLFTRNIPNKMPNPNLEHIEYALTKISKQLSSIELLYILDAKGKQIIDSISDKKEQQIGKDENRSNRAYYYRAVKEKKCILTDPYPCLFVSGLTVTASYPIYDDKNNLKYVVCIDISLSKLIKIVQPTTVSVIFKNFSKIVYTIFTIALFAVACLLFYVGVTSINLHSGDIHLVDIKEMFESTILLTLSLAIFDLVKAIFEEEVLEKSPKGESFEIHKTMTKFLGSIIIALAIEALMLVFKFAITGPEKIIYAVYLIGGVTMLLFALSFYLKFTNEIKDRN